VSQPKNNTKSGGILSTLIICLVLVAIAAVAIIYRQQIYDQINYWDYTPSSQMASFVQRDAMSGEGKLLFYSAHPQLDDATQFNKNCTTSSSNMAIIGCYDGQNIYIYNVTNTQLDGIRDVTAAYEMLHAAYKRLSPSDLAQVNQLVEAEYSKLNDPTINQLVSFFATSEPGQRDNELFSIIATQIPNISPKLEAYYSRYFTNRQAVVALYNKYISVFKSLKTKADNLSSQITTMISTISSLSSQYNTNAQQLNSDIDTFNTEAKDGYFTSVAEFDSARAVLVQRTAELESDRSTIQSDIGTYQNLLTQYNSIATQSQKLYDTINSTLVSSPSV
jgi:hypothetical protein